MTNWCFVIVFLSVLQLSSSLVYREYNLGKVNDTTYLIKENAYSIPRHLELITESDGTIQKLLIPSCDSDRLVLQFDSIKLQGNSLFFLRKNIDDGQKLLQIVDLSDLLRNDTSEICIPVADAFFGKQNIYIYRIEDDTVLVRWIVTPDGKLINSKEIVRVENRIREVHVLSRYIELRTDSNDASNFDRAIYPRDLSRCSNTDSTGLCEEDTKIDFVPFTEYEELYIDTVNDTTYIFKQYWYSHKMELMLIEQNNTFETYEIPRCALDTVSAFYGNVELRGNILFLRSWRLKNNDVLLNMVKLSELVGNSTNETCLAVAGVYFAEDKVYVYQIEEGNTLVRSLITPDGELADPRTIATTQNEIEQVTIHEDGVLVKTKANDTNGSPDIEILHDLQGCGSLENGTACEEDQSSDDLVQLLSNSEETFGENVTTTEKIPVTEAAKEEILESNVSFKVVVICIGLLVLVLFAIAYLLCSSNFKSKEKRETYSKVNAGHYNVVSQRANAGGNSV